LNRCEVAAESILLTRSHLQPLQPHFQVQYNRVFTTMWLHLNHVLEKIALFKALFFDPGSWYTCLLLSCVKSRLLSCVKPAFVLSTRVWFEDGLARRRSYAVSRLQCRSALRWQETVTMAKFHELYKFFNAEFRNSTSRGTQCPLSPNAGSTASCVHLIVDDGHSAVMSSHFHGRRMIELLFKSVKVHTAQEYVNRTSVLIATFFVWWFSSSKGIYYTSQTLERYVRKKVIFGEKSRALSSLFQILR